MPKSCNTSLLALALLLVPGVAICQPTPFEQFLGTFSGLASIPPNASPGVGPLVLYHDPTVRWLTVDLAFSDLQGPTTTAHIHCCIAPGSNIGVAIPFSFFPAGVDAGSYQSVFDLASASVYLPAFITAHGGTTEAAEAALIAGLRNGYAYVDIHSTIFPGGEIRTYVKSVVFLDDFELGDYCLWSTVAGAPPC